MSGQPQLPRFSRARAILDLAIAFFRFVGLALWSLLFLALALAVTKNYLGIDLIGPARERYERWQDRQRIDAKLRQMFGPNDGIDTRGI